MTEDSQPILTKGRLFLLAVIWVLFIGGIALGYRWFWLPMKKEEAKTQAVTEKKETLQKTSAHSRYTSSVSMALDNFSGYAPLRSPAFQEECAKFGIRMELSDDGANYQERYKKLASGELDMALFTIDALIKTSAEHGELPASIVAVLDESKGADAMVAAGRQFPNIDSLNAPDTKFVCVKDSPTETLARVIMAHFNLDKLGPEPFEYLDNADAVYKMYQTAKPEDKKVFVVWEPYISRITENPDYHILLDSSKFKGFIVDVIVARRSFLVKSEPQVEKVVKSYLSTIFQHRNGMTELVLEDAKQLGQPLKKEQAEKLVKTVWWKNTQEMYGHFGITSGTNLQHMEEMCRNITGVLQKTGAISSDPTNGQPNMWFYDGIVRKLFDQSWHPGFGQEQVRQERQLLALTEMEWSELKPVGTLHVPRLVFARGTDKIGPSSEATLLELVENLKAFPQYYLVVKGNAASDGDLEANLRLATARAKAATEWLIEHGVDKNRIRAEAAKPNGSTTVSFVLGEQPY